MGKKQRKVKSVPQNAITFWGKAWTDSDVYFYASGHEPTEILPLYIPPFMGVGALDLCELHFTLLKGCTDDFIAHTATKRRPCKKTLKQRFGPLFHLSRDVNSIASFLHKKARSGDHEAARRLFFMAQFATELLEDLMLETPKALHGFIEEQGRVPVMATTATNWADTANTLLSTINFAKHFRGFWHGEKGLNLKAFDCRESPTRQFALYCFHLLDWNRYLMKTVIGRKKCFLTFLKKAYPKITWHEPQAWVLQCEFLPKFENKPSVVNAWHKVLVDMIELECPDFYQDKKWHDSWKRDEYKKRKAPFKNIHAYEYMHPDFDRNIFFRDLGPLIRKRILEDIRNILPHLAAKLS